MGGFSNDAIVAMIAFREAWVDQLYVLPDFKGQGFGRQLLDLAKRANEHLQLWTFQRNIDAQRFYRRNGFIEITRTDGLDNEEREPDVLLEWSGKQLIEP